MGEAAQEQEQPVQMSSGMSGVQHSTASKLGEKQKQGR
jgi:hypothetical protein